MLYGGDAVAQLLDIAQVVGQLLPEQLRRAALARPRNRRQHSGRIDRERRTPLSHHIRHCSAHIHATRRRLRLHRTQTRGDIIPRGTHAITLRLQRTTIVPLTLQRNR
jgi:hypothetical protein